MADIYVRAGASNTSPYDTWAKAATTLVTAVGIATSSDTIWVADDHTETTAGAITFTMPSSPGLKVLLANTHVTQPPTGLGTPLSVSIQNTGNTSITFLGYAYIYGLEIFCSASGGSNQLSFITSGNTGTGNGMSYDNCRLRIGSTHAQSNIFFGPSLATTSGAGAHTISNTDLWFSNVGQSIVFRRVHGRFSNITVNASGSVPTTLITSIAGTSGDVIFESSDISGVAITNLINIGIASSSTFLFRNCKLPTNIVVATGSFTGPEGPTIDLHNCDSANTNYRFSRNTYTGSTVNENTITMVNGATNGATSESFKMVSSAGSSIVLPLRSPEISLYNSIVGSSQTITMDFIHDSVTALTNADIWIDLIYMSSSGSPVASVASGRASTVITTPSAWSASSSTWNGTSGFTNPNKQSMTVSFTAQQTGYVIARVSLAQASKTVYVSPKLQGLAITNVQAILPGFGYVNQVGNNGFSFGFAG